MIKLAAFDIDGTLVNSRKILPERVENAVISAQKLGITAVVATGRPAFGARSVVEGLKVAEFGGYVIEYNGARVSSAAQPQTAIAEIPFPIEYLKEICEYIRTLPVSISTYHNNQIVAGNELTEYVRRNARIMNMPLKYVGRLEDYVDFTIYKCLVTGETEILRSLQKELSERFAGRLSVFMSDAFLLELVACGVNKGVALQSLCSRLGLSAEDCIAFGDNDNDLQMLEFAGLGIAMGNSTEQVKAVADKLAPDCDDDGVAVVLENLLEI